MSLKISCLPFRLTAICALSTLSLAFQRPSLARVAPQSAPAMLKFDFRSGPAAANTTKITPSTLYSSQTGYGFEPGNAPIAAVAAPAGALAEKPSVFSVALPEGNYNVTLTLGDEKSDSNTTVKAESRRLMLQDVKTAPGEFVTRSFTVNIRNASLKSGQKVRLKAREVGVLHWDDKLTLEFNGARPRVAELDIVPAPDSTTVYIAGDSTVTDQPEEPWAGWGQMLPRFFKTGVSVANYAESGETLRAFLGEKRLEKILDNIRAGDYLFIQFGHNDMKEKGEGIGAFTSYSDSLRILIAAARKVGATPVLVTSMQRRRFSAEGKIEDTLGDYPEAVRRVAAAEKVALIDLNAMSTAFYEALGPEGSKRAFVHYPANTFPGQTVALKDDTHFNSYGAFQLAKAIVQGIKMSVPELARHLTNDVTNYDPAHPDAVENWNLPASPAVAIQKPEGS